MSASRMFTLNRNSSNTRLVTVLLAVGTFAFGVGEFASMTLLPSISSEMGVDEGTAGHIITAYALGVVLGAPVISAVGAKWPRKPLLLALLLLLTAGNLFVSAAPSMSWLVAGRFVSGIPHGAFIGLAMVTASSINLPTKQARAVSTVQMGITVATIVGVPLFTLVGQFGGWRASFVLMSVISAIALGMLWNTVPNQAGNKAANSRVELSALTNPKVLLTLVTGAIGFGGIFAVYSYFSSAFEGSHAGPGWAMSLILMLYGVGSTVGSYVAGFIHAKILLPAAMAFQVLLGLSAVLYAVGIGNAWVTGIAMVLIGASGGMVVPLQTRLMMAAGDAQTMAAAMNNVAFNLANALGPFLAGTAMSNGGTWASTGWIAAALALGGLFLLGANVLSDRRTPVTRYAVRFEPQTLTVPITGVVPVAK